MKVIWTQEEACIDALAGKKDYVLGAPVYLKQEFHLPSLGSLEEA
jgi:hypothetical protein